MNRIIYSNFQTIFIFTGYFSTAIFLQDILGIFHVFYAFYPWCPKPPLEALARRRAVPRAPMTSLRPVRRVPVAQRRAAVIAAGPNKSVGWGAQYTWWTLEEPCWRKEGANDAGGSWWVWGTNSPLYCISLYSSKISIYVNIYNIYIYYIYIYV